MIDVRAKIHDKFSVEFKTSFVTRRKLKDNDFMAFMWVFIPNSLDINPNTYTKDNFYQDIKSNIRLKTPQYLLQDIAQADNAPLCYLTKAFSNLASKPTRSAIREYEYQIKMYSAIAHSAMRDASKYIRSSKQSSDDIPVLTTNYIDAARRVVEAYRDAHTLIAQPTVNDSLMRCFYYGDEYLTSIMRYYNLHLLNNLLNRKDEQQGLEECIKTLQQFIRDEEAHADKRGYIRLKKDNTENGRDVTYRHGVLKKYVDSDLYLDVPKKKDGKIIEQLYFSIAAGLAMMFATVVSFHFQQKYGNFTLPFFIILVISYMIKDRIKELSRFYFAHRIGTRFFDHKARLRVKDEKIGTIKEAMDFCSDANIPENVRRVRYSKRLMDIEKRISDEKIMLYRMSLHINRERLNNISIYETTGINDIIRLNVNSFLKKMDNPKVYNMIMNPDGSVGSVACDKIYYINIVLQLKFENNDMLRRYRVALSRNGIEGFYEIKNTD